MQIIKEGGGGGDRSSDKDCGWLNHVALRPNVYCVIFVGILVDLWSFHTCNFNMDFLQEKLTHNVNTKFYIAKLKRPILW